MDEDRIQKEWEKAEELLTPPLRARIQEYHTEGVKALLDFHSTVGRLLKDDSR